MEVRGTGHSEVKKRKRGGRKGTLIGKGGENRECALEILRSLTAARGGRRIKTLIKKDRGEKSDLQKKEEITRGKRG